jgi:predicted RecB family nuclease
MRIAKQQLEISASDLAKHLACRHLTSLDLRAARGEINRPYWHDPAIAVLQERGFRHEAAYLSYLKDQGHTILADENGLDEQARLQRTVEAMKAGIEVIAQADLGSGNWRGRADILMKVNRPSRFGNWSYEVIDTKLARETRGGTILQLCLYSELLAELQGVIPDRMHVVTPRNGFQPETFRVHDFLAYYRFVKSRLEDALGGSGSFETYPGPVEHCEICQWWPRCNDRRRSDDHLSFVAGISKLQIRELRTWDVTTLASLAADAFAIE